MADNPTITFGRHKGESIQRVPVNYLKWMVNIGSEMSVEAEAELDRRGTVTPTLEVSGHAIDRASLCLRIIWHETRGENEGIHAWLCRVSRLALDRGECNGDQKVKFAGMKFVFEKSGVWPVLKTVMPSGSNKDRRIKLAKQSIPRGDAGIVRAEGGG